MHPPSTWRSPNPSVTVSGGEAFKEVTKILGDRKAETVTEGTAVPRKRGKDVRSKSVQRKGRGQTRGGGSHLGSRRRRRQPPPLTVIPRPQSLGEQKCVLCEPPSQVLGQCPKRTDTLR